MSASPRILQLAAGRTCFYLRDQAGLYLARTCGDDQTAQAIGAEIVATYNRNAEAELALKKAMDRVRDLEDELRAADIGANKRLQRMLDAEDTVRRQREEIAELRADIEKEKAAMQLTADDMRELESRSGDAGEVLASLEKLSPVGIWFGHLKDGAATFELSKMDDDGIEVIDSGRPLGQWRTLLEAIQNAVKGGA